MAGLSYAPGAPDVDPGAEGSGAAVVAVVAVVAIVEMDQQRGAVTRRFAEVDVWKASGICAVVLIHSMRPSWDPRLSGLEASLMQLTRFGVPAFCAASGFLYASLEGVGVARTLARLRRVLVPYLIASAGAQLYWLLEGSGPQRGVLWKDLLYAASFGPYYYVVVAASFVLLTPGLSRIGRSGIAFCLVLALPAQGLLEEASGLVFDFWRARNPAMWLAYFLAGWMLRIHYDPVVAFVSRHRLWLTAGFGAALVALSLPGAPAPASPTGWLVEWVGIYAVLGLLFCLACGRETRSAAARALSDATYPIYLFHLFAVKPLSERLLTGFGEPNLPGLALIWSAGLATGWAVILLSRRLLGERSRDWIGA